MSAERPSSTRKTQPLIVVALQRLVRRVFCRHALAWVRNIHGDEINATGCRTVWICEKCGRYIYDRDYVMKSSAIKVYDPTNSTVLPPKVGSDGGSTP